MVEPGSITLDGRKAPHLVIVPTSRLLSWVALVVLPFSLLAAVEPASGTAALLIVGAFLAFVAADALRAPHQLGGIAVELPAAARLTKDREGQLEVRIQNPGRRPKHLRLALALPRGFESSQEETEILLPADTEWSRLSWRLFPRRRGRCRIDAAHLEIASPLGFWRARRRLSLQCEVRVYPNLLADRRSVAAFFLHRGSAGLRAHRQVGRGREFEKLRDYVPGDNFDEIHWKATAKRGRPITKVFQVERTQEVYVVVDASRLSARPVTPPPAPPLSPKLTEKEQSAEAFSVNSLERFVTAALTLGLVAQKQGDLFGLLTFTDKVEAFVRAGGGKCHYAACRDALLGLEPRIVTPDFDEVFAFLRMRLRRRALLVFLTALDDPVLAESFVRNAEKLRREHVVLVNMLKPQGVAPIFSNAAVSSVDELYTHLGGHFQWRQLREIENVLRRQGMRFSLLDNERLMPELVSRYLSVKQRQML
jgi:uncharacterized protein (DUF58 family)